VTVPGELILIVEDNEKNMKLFRDVLRVSGYATVEAGNAEEGVELALEHEPALVLKHAQLPGLDGEAALALLRADERTAAIPVLAVTAQAMRGDHERFIDAGFDGYLSKPVDIAELLGAVKKHCER
jgi:two-component system cell cycle response regulator DivK